MSSHLMHGNLKSVTMNYKLYPTLITRTANFWQKILNAKYYQLSRNIQSSSDHYKKTGNMFKNSCSI